MNAGRILLSGADCEPIIRAYNADRPASCPKCGGILDVKHFGSDGFSFNADCLTCESHFNLTRPANWPTQFTPEQAASLKSRAFSIRGLRGPILCPICGGKVQSQRVGPAIILHCSVCHCH
jgi:hypothetical protein